MKNFLQASLIIYFEGNYLLFTIKIIIPLTAVTRLIYRNITIVRFYFLSAFDFNSVTGIVIILPIGLPSL